MRFLEIYVVIQENEASTASLRQERRKKKGQDTN